MKSPIGPGSALFCGICIGATVTYLAISVRNRIFYAEFVADQIRQTKSIKIVTAYAALDSARVREELDATHFCELPFYIRSPRSLDHRVLSISALCGDEVHDVGVGDLTRARDAGEVQRFLRLWQSVVGSVPQVNAAGAAAPPSAESPLLSSLNPLAAQPVVAADAPKAARR